MPLPVPPPTGAAWASVLFLALVASAAAMVALSWAQSRMSATRAAVILTMEPAAAGVTAAVMGATLELRILLGGSLLIVAMLVVEIGSRKGKPFLVACDESSGAIRY
jgi:drug/metabolite transporter (DMT)-like permease